jgi:hypothetical protein
MFIEGDVHGEHVDTGFTHESERASVGVGRDHAHDLLGANALTGAPGC